MSVYRRNGDGKIVKSSTASGVWWFDFTIKGKRYKGSIAEAKSKSEAQDIEAAKRREVKEGRYGKPPLDTAFDDFVRNVYLKTSKRNKRSHRTDQVHAKVLCAYFKGQALRDITPAAINVYREMRLEQKTIRGTLRSVASVNRERALLSAIFTQAVDLGYCDKNPCSRVKRYKESGQRTRVLSQAEEVRLMAALTGNNADLHPIVVCALGTGMRRGEMLSMRWLDVDFGTGFIHLRAETTKTAEARSVPMNDDVKETLSKMRTIKSTGKVFDIHPQRVTRRLGKICDELEMPDVTLHVLRHTFITRLNARGVNPFYIQMIVGHSSLSMTKHYTHINPSELQAAVRKT